MSRCYPFPPPGYERKPKADGNVHTDVIKKEKHKEKKHKKDKKDKEKKDGKEKREKERSDERHREKKDKREKRRDKKKDKEKDRDKDKHKSNLLPVEKKIVGSADSHVYNPSEKNKERESDKNAISAEKKIGGLSAVHNGIPVSKNNHQIYEAKSFNHASDLGRKSVDEERRTINQYPNKNIGAERRKDGVVKLDSKSGGSLLDSKERTKEKPTVDERMDGRGAIGDAKSGGSALVSNPVGVVQNRVGGIVRPVDKKIEQKVDGKGKNREKEGGDRKGEKRKEKDREKSVLKDKDRKKEKKKDEIAKATTEQKQIHVTRMKDGSDDHMQKPSTKDANKKDISGVQSVGSQNNAKDSNYHATTMNNNLKKRKDIGLNGIYDEFVTRPNKLARTTASPHPLTENGRSLEPCQNSAAFAPVTQRPPTNSIVEHNLSHDDTQRPAMKIKVDGKECKINGTVAEPSTQSSRETTAKAERKSVAPTKPPHPDTKYLDQVLSVPKLDEWSGFDDQDWLLNSNCSPTRKPEVKSSGINEMPQVWARALWLEPVDVYALPYVIPH
ncbi:zinc finger CCCH domain-containing protein 13-like [Chenopodium quinoa]|uniref:zinc finger CCCH domain-containing protein 13-like n=1 Tax=Chenopodium quinoa TaxID=63459 RepID=UPI000B77541D|nr:zinc finger CCCH domain-containing protein 13-like [Chenopodium quinoa]